MTKLRDYQEKGVEKIERMDGCAVVADDMGLGKTIQVLTYLDRNWKQASPVIVVCPAGAKYVWKRQAEEHIGLTAQILSHRSPPKHFRAEADMLIINYEILRGWLTVLDRYGARLLVADEAHYMVNQESDRTQNMLWLAEEIDHRLALTGTPVMNSPAELWPILHFVRPDLFPSFQAFAWEYTFPKRLPWGWEYREPNSEALPSLHEFLEREVMLRRLKRDVMTELPSKTRSVVLLDIEHRKEYDEAHHNFLNWLARTHGGRALDGAERAEGLQKAAHLRRLAVDLKTKAVVKWLEDFFASSGEKVLFGGYHHFFMDEIQRSFRRSVRVDGTVPTTKREAIYDRFNLDKEIDILIGQLRAAGTAWSCTSSSNVVVGEFDWNPAVHTQFGARIDGIGRGQTGKAGFEYWLVARDTIEERICRALQKKQDTANAILDGGKGEELNVFDLVMEGMTAEGKRK